MWIRNERGFQYRGKFKATSSFGPVQTAHCNQWRDASMKIVMIAFNESLDEQVHNILKGCSPVRVRPGK